MFALAACGGASTQSSGGNAAGDKVKITYVGCAAPSGFHGTIAKGAETAAQQMGNVVFQYVFPDKTAPDQFNQVLETAIASKPDGIALCGLDPKSAQQIVAEGVKKGIKFSLSPSDEPYAQHPLRGQDDLYISRVGSDEGAAGKLAGQQIVADGAKGLVLCAGPISTDSTMVQRCNGAKSAVEAAGGTFEMLDVVDEPGQATEILTQYLRRHPAVTGVLTPGLGAEEAIQTSLQQSGLKIPVGTWDLYQVNLDGIKAGVVKFTIDQQQFLRGYMPVQDLVMNIRYGFVRSNWYLTGPSIVGPDDIAVVEKSVAAGFR